MSAYKIMTARGLAEFIMEQPLDEEYFFATVFDVSQKEPGAIPIELEESCDPENWYGIKKMQVFDRDVILMGMGGQFAHTIIDAEDLYLEDLARDIRAYFENWIFEGVKLAGEKIVCLRLEDEEVAA